MKKDYIDNINSILSSGVVENEKLERIDLLRNILLDSQVEDSIYQQFLVNFKHIDDNDMFFTKIQDLVYRLHYAINKWLIPIHKIENEDDIKIVIQDLVDQDIDFYSAVSYDDSDKEMIEEFDDVYERKIKL